VSAAPGRVMAAALISDAANRVLLVRPPGSQARWQLPTVTELGSGETPRQAGVRAVRQQVGLVPLLGEVLVCEWIPGAAGAPLYVFDAGQLSRTAAKRLKLRAGSSDALPATGSSVEFVAVADLSAFVPAADQHRIAAALRARTEHRGSYLEDGRRPTVLAAMQRFGIAPAVHSGAAWSWHERAVPQELPIKHAWVWVFAPDGRVVVYVDENGQLGLPGGTLEDDEHRDPRAAAIREVREETQLEISEPRYLGYLLDDRPGNSRVARVRMAAAITTVGAAAPDPATGTTHRRLLVPPGLVAELCGWGPSADRQTEAALAAAAALGITGADPAAGISELPVAAVELERLPGTGTTDAARCLG
jgi:ADP-ribose pyrophosphatase YjhB (NUDIX family)